MHVQCTEGTDLKTISERKMNRIPLYIAALLAGLFTTVAFAQESQEKDFDVVEEKMRMLVPNAKTIAISETPIEGVLQIQINSDIVYATTDGQYLLQGQLIDLSTRENLTDQAKSGIRASLLTGLDSDQQITYSPVEPKYDLLVFTDIDCGYCRKLHNQMAEYNEEGIAIHYLAFPRAGVGSDSYEKFVSVWCADDQQTALTLAKNGTDPEPLSCTNPIAEQYNLGQELGVTGTPSIVTADGTMIPGYMPPAQLRQRLESMAVVTE
jgi:thiol:disulfide interchange protein DsbC